MDSSDSGIRQTRRLSAVMFTDMVGYSGLMQRNEALGIELLAEHRSIVRAILPKYGGRVVDTAGDAFFVVFESALEATLCAIEIQTALHNRNEGTSPERQIVLRIGLHLGDVVHVGDQVQGDGVNIAARMEPLARPGSICVSEDVARQVHNKIDSPVAPFGRRQLKNIRLPMDAYRIVMPWEDDFGSVIPFNEFTARIRKTGRSRARWLPYLLAAIAVIVGLGWLAVNQTGLDPMDVDPEVSSSTVAVLPFTVQGSPELAYLGKGMVDLLSTKLDGAAGLRAVDPRAILGIASQSGIENLDPEAARDVARRLGAGTYVMGNILEIGGNLRIDATVYSGDRSRSTGQGTVEGTAVEIFGLLDRLAAQLIVSNRDGSDVSVERLDAMTTTSFEALKHYLQGVNAFRSARFQVAADELSLAVAEDSTFALAWYQLSATAEWLFDPVLALSAVENATRHADRLSERGQRLIRAMEASKSGRSEEAFQRYRDFLTSYPDDVEAWYQLGELVFHSGPLIGVSPEESLEAWEKLLYFEPDQVTALIHMARVWLLKGEDARVDSVATVIFDLEPVADRNLELRAHLAFNRGDEEAVSDVTKRLRGASDDMLMEVVWSVACFRDDPGPALLLAALLTEETRPAEVRNAGLVIQAYLLAAKGRFEDAVEVMHQASSIGNYGSVAYEAFLTLLPFRSQSEAQLGATRARLRAWDAASVPKTSKTSGWYSVHDDVYPYLRQYLLGVTDALEGDRAAALEIAQGLVAESVRSGSESLLSDLAVGIKAQLAQREGRFGEGVRLFREAERHSSYQYTVSSPFFALSRERFVFGQNLEGEGMDAEAVKVLSFFEGHSTFDWVFQAPSHLRRAALFRRAGNEALEVEHLEKFVELWADCDAELQPLVAEARTRLAELK